MKISRRVMRRWHPRLRSLLLELIDEGYSVEHGGKHAVLRSPDGRRVATFPMTPSDHRAGLNTVSNIRRAL